MCLIDTQLFISNLWSNYLKVGAKIIMHLGIRVLPKALVLAPSIGWRQRAYVEIRWRPMALGVSSGNRTTNSGKLYERRRINKVSIYFDLIPTCEKPYQMIRIAFQLSLYQRNDLFNCVYVFNILWTIFRLNGMYSVDNIFLFLFLRCAANIY